MTQIYTNFKLKVDAVIRTTLASYIPIPEDVIKGVQDIPAFRPIRFANIIGEIMRVQHNPIICAMMVYNDWIACLKEFHGDIMKRSTFGRWYEWNGSQYSKYELLTQLTIIINNIKKYGSQLVWKLRYTPKDNIDKVTWTLFRDKARACINITESDAPNPLEIPAAATPPSIDVVPVPITLDELRSVECNAPQPTTPVGDTYEPIDIGPIC